MDYLVLSPPVIPPSEPPSGAFLLTAALRGHGFDAGFLDLSPAFFDHLFEDAPDAAKRSLRYLKTERWYTPDAHRSAAGHLHSAVSTFSEQYTGWKLTLMDIAPPHRVHHPRGLARMLTEIRSPFRRHFESVLQPVLDAERPRRVLISLAYLSQLPAAIDLHDFLAQQGISPIVGGSLPTSLHTTGHGIETLRDVFPEIMTGDGGALISPGFGERMLDRLSWPRILGRSNYISSRPIIPLVLSSGCYWNRCLFCPDRGQPYFSLPTRTISDFIESIPSEWSAARPVIHLLDAALPPKALRAFLPLARAHGLGFFGFARPTVHLLKDRLIEDAADAGCLMLQLGAEGGSEALLDRFDKGISPVESREVILRAAAAGIRTYLYLLFGLPGETASDLSKTLHWTQALGESIDFLNLSLFNLPRYCELTDRADEFGIHIGDYPEDEEDGIRLYHPFSSEDADPRQAARTFLKTFRAAPVVRKAYLQTPRWFRAAHLALMRLDNRREL